jgi:hypothetical protein
MINYNHGCMILHTHILKDVYIDATLPILYGRLSLCYHSIIRFSTAIGTRHLTVFDFYDFVFDCRPLQPRSAAPVEARRCCAITYI